MNDFLNYFLFYIYLFVFLLLFIYYLFDFMYIVLFYGLFQNFIFYVLGQSCNGQGTCSLNNTCQCMSGYTGDTCQLSPPTILQTSSAIRLQQTNAIQLLLSFYSMLYLLGSVT